METKIQLFTKDGMIEVDVNKKTNAELKAMGLGNHHLVIEKDFKERYAKAETDSERINIMAEKAGLK